MKSFGIIFAFFGIVAILAVVADTCSGRTDITTFLDVLRAALRFFLGSTLFFAGMHLIKLDHARIPQRFRR